MTKEHALKEMKIYSRDVVKLKLAEQVAAAFGTTLKEVGIKPLPVEGQNLGYYNPKYKGMLSVDMCYLTRAICKHITGQEVYSDMLGHGSARDDMTYKATAQLEMYLAKQKSPATN